MKVGDEKNPGIAIGWADDAKLHACLGVAVAPVPQGADAAASGVAVRAWFSALVVAINADSPVALEGGNLSLEFFHQLSIVEYGDVVQALHSRPINLVWGPALDAAGLSAGGFFMVTKARDKNNVMRQSFVPFL